MNKPILASLALAIAAPCAALAQTPTAASSDLAQLRQEIAALRSSYESRLQQLEQRLQAAERGTAPPPSPSPPALAAAPAAASPAAGSPPAAAHAFNPAISLILSGLYTRTSLDPALYSLGGFLLPTDAEAGPGSRGFSLAETELGFAASIDPWWRGVANIALHGDNSVSVEEAYVQTTALGKGLTLKAGRFLSGIGYLNARHAHTWDFVDSPLAYQALLGSQYGDDGAQLRWLAPTDQYLALGLEVGRGRGFPGGDNAGNGAGMAALTAHTGGDLGDSHSWRAGLSVLSAKASDQALVGLDSGGDSLASSFSGRTRVWVADAVWKWAPGGNATRTSFKLQGEYLQSRRSGSLVLDPAATASSSDYRAQTSGWYLQGVYQFMPRWRLGLRGERLDAGAPDYGSNSGRYAADGFAPRKTSLMLDFSSSEFSRIRLQLAQDQSAAGRSDRQVLLQYQMSLGAHGAHGY